MGWVKGRGHGLFKGKTDDDVRKMLTVMKEDVLEISWWFLFLGGLNGRKSQNINE